MSLCAGAGGLDMGLGIAEPGFHTRCFVEWEEYPRRAIIAAQRAGYFAPAPIWDDLRSFDGRPWQCHIDTILAGYPCQPFSAAGQRKGADDDRHLWPDVARIIREVQPEWVFLENVAGHISLGLETVLRELWDMGWTPAAGAFSAAEVGAPHERLRVFIVAHRNSDKPSADRREPYSGPDGRHDTCRCGGDAMAHPHGRHPGEEREQRGGKQRFQPHGRGTVDAGRRRDDLADTSGPEREGQQQWQHHAVGRQVKDGYSALPRGAGLFPPGPGDAAAWASVLGMAPHLAPAVSFGDLKRACDHFAQMVARGELEEAEAESTVRVLADGLSTRSSLLRILGNAVVPITSAYAWRELSSAHGLEPS